MAIVSMDPAALVVGVLSSHPKSFSELISHLVERFGQVSMMSPWMPFTDTPYYEKEMGGLLRRRAMVFSKEVVQDRLAEIKRWTNTLEEEFSRKGGRTVNIDPGILLPGRFVLATTKDFTHRICLGGGIYADLTLVYKDGAYRTLPWTYPDYAKGPMHEFLTDARRRFVAHGSRMHMDPFRQRC